MDKDMTEQCELPPEGWSCSRPKGHPGPCSATVDLPAGSPSEVPGLVIYLEDMDESSKDDLLKETLGILAILLQNAGDDYRATKLTTQLFGRLTAEGVIL